VRQEFVRCLQEDARAVPGVAFAATSTTVLKIQKYLDGLLHYVVPLAALQVNDETNTTSVVLALGIVQALFCWCAYHPGHLLLLDVRHVCNSLPGSKLKQKPAANQKAINLLIDGLIGRCGSSIRPSSAERVLRNECDVRRDANW
jgi:hypothetical protein